MSMLLHKIWSDTVVLNLDQTDV